MTIETGARRGRLILAAGLLCVAAAGATERHGLFVLGTGLVWIGAAATARRS